MARVIFPEHFSDYDWFNLPRKGWGTFKVESGGELDELTFYDLARLTQALEEEPICVANTGMIVLKEANRATIEAAVNHLEETGFSLQLVPIGNRNAGNRG